MSVPLYAPSYAYCAASSSLTLAPYSCSTSAPSTAARPAAAAGSGPNAATAAASETPGFAPPPGAP